MGARSIKCFYILICRLQTKMQQFYFTLVIILVWFGMDIKDYPGTTAVWVSLEGCYISVRQNSSHNPMPKNGPRHCFDACPNSTYIGLKDSWCMCDTIGKDYALSQFCNYQCSGEMDMLCGSGRGIAVYSKVNQAQSISVSGDFGCVYVHVSVPSSGRVHNLTLFATNNCSEKHFFAYFDAFIAQKCVYEQRELETWFKARDKFASGTGTKFLLPERYVRDDICPPQTDQGINIYDGTFWIGMIWIATDMTTTSMTTMAMTSTRLTNTTTTRTEITTEDQPTKRSTATSSTIVSTTQGSLPSIDLTAVYIAVPVGVCVSVVVVIICWCRKCCCFRSCREGVETDKQKIPDVTPLKAINAPSSVPPSSTRAAFQEHPENVRPIMTRQTDIQGGQYAVSNTKRSDEDRPEDPSVEPGTSYTELQEGRQSSISKEGKGKEKRKKKKKKKDKHQVNVAKENREISCKADNHAEMDRSNNEDHSVVNESTEYPNNESKDYGKKKKKKEKKQRKYSCSNEERSNTSAETCDTIRPVTSSGVRVRVSAYDHMKSIAKHNDSRNEEKKKLKRSRKGQQRASNGLFDVPANYPVLEM